MSEETKAKEYVANAKDSCKACKNFGTSSCPAFKEAVEGQKIDADALSEEIKREQKGKKLQPCANVPK